MQQPEHLEFGAKRPAMYYAPPQSDEKRPLIVMLHGMCALPEYECPVFREGAPGSTALLCPPGPTSCPEGDGRMWIGSSWAMASSLTKSLRALGERHSGRIDTRRKALVGYSLGGMAAMRIVQAQPGQWSGLMIVNAGVEPSAATLRRAGIKRVALVAGERDRTAGKLRRAAARLQHVGFDARYFSMGAVGHYFDSSSASRLNEALTWLSNGL